MILAVKMKKAIRYIEQSLNCMLSTKSVGVKKLPLSLVARFDIAECSSSIFGGAKVLLVFDKGTQPWTVGGVITACRRIEDLLGNSTIFVADDIPRFKRARMREKHFDFVCANTEIHLPSWRIVQTEYAPAIKVVREGLGFPAQRILLAHLNHLFEADISIASVQSLLGYSKMTAIAAFDQLEHADLAIRLPMSGSRGLALHFLLDGRALWDKASPFLRTPVIEKIGLSEWPHSKPQIASGESALSEISMLNPPEHQIFAFFGDARERAELKYSAIPIEEGRYIAELWQYPPLLFGQTKIDPLSTILVTKDIANDPRVEGEHESILEDFKW